MVQRTATCRGAPVIPESYRSLNASVFVGVFPVETDSPAAWNAATIDREADMSVIARAISHTLLSTSRGDVLRHGLLFCGAGLLVSLLLLTYGLDLSPGFF